MREHMGLYKGKRIDTGEWVEGYLYEHEPPLNPVRLKGDVPKDSNWYILKTGFADWNMPRQVEFYEVDPDTIGECTGLKDKNGKLIFEGDIVRYPDGFGVTVYGDATNEGVVDWDEEVMCFYFTERWTVDMSDFDVCDGKMTDVEIIGNIHDNGELLKGDNNG